MTWTELDWPDLSPHFPEPQPATLPPPRPEVPARVAERVHRAEVTRGIVVPLCVLAGAGLVCAGLAVYRGAPSGGGARAPLAALLLLLAGIVVAFAVPALATLRIGPTWEQRQQHWRLQQWELERRAWLAREQAIYIAALPSYLREPFHRALTSSPPIESGEAAP